MQDYFRLNAIYKFLERICQSLANNILFLSSRFLIKNPITTLKNMVHMNFWWPEIWQVVSWREEFMLQVLVQCIYDVVLTQGFYWHGNYAILYFWDPKKNFICSCELKFQEVWDVENELKLTILFSIKLKQSKFEISW